MAGDTVRGHDRDTDGGTGDRTTTRRAALKALGTGGAAAVGLTAVSGTAAAGNCLELTKQDAPDDFPIVTEYFDGYGDLPLGSDPLTIFVHGWQAELGGDAWGQSYLCQQALRDNGYDDPVIGFKYWANNFWWPDAIDDAHDAGSKLARFIQWYDDEYAPDEIRVIAHSLGGHVTLRCLDDLQADGDSITSLSLLGAAVDVDIVAQGNERYDAVRDGADQVDNFYSAEDDVLEYIYSIGEFGDEALGEQGVSGTAPGNYDEFDVTGSIGDHCEYFQPDTGCVGDVVDEF